MRGRPKPKWESEAAMFASFLAAVGDDAVPYPESGGHDLLLVVQRPLGDELQPGDVVAVEGKLRPNVHVLYQALPPWRRSTADGSERQTQRAADFYVVLLPEADPEFREVAHALGIVTLTWWPELTRTRASWEPRWWQPFLPRYRVTGYDRIEGLLSVPMPAGAPAPRAVSPWKVAAVRICLAGAQRDLVPADFERTPVRARTFLDRGWAEVTERDGRKHAAFRLLDHPGRPDRAYPELVAALELAGFPMAAGGGR